MTCLIIFGILWLILTVLIIIRSTIENDELAAGLGLSGFLAFIFFLLCILFCYLTTGLYQTYSEGERVGFVTKMSYKGLIWKTYEGEQQLGTGELVATQEAFAFSVVDKEVLKVLQDSMTKKERLKLTYREWLIMPWHIGSSGYEIVKVEILE